MAAHDASHVYVALSVAGTTRIRCIDFGFVTCSVLHISGDCVSVHGSVASALGLRAAVSR